MSLLNRNISPPQGWLYFEVVNMRLVFKIAAPLNESFNSAVKQIMAFRLGNPQFGLPSDFDSVALALDNFTCNRLNFNSKYCVGEQKKNQMVPRPARRPIQGQRVKPQKAPGVVARLVGGGNALKDWLGDGGIPVAQELANERSHACACRNSELGKCPMNNTDPSLLDQATHVLATAIKQQRETKLRMSLKTPDEEKLGTCVACGCDLGLKVWVPLHHILDNTSEETMQRFDPECWILKERPQINENQTATAPANT